MLVTHSLNNQIWIALLQTLSRKHTHTRFQCSTADFQPTVGVRIVLPIALGSCHHTLKCIRSLSLSHFKYAYLLLYQTSGRHVIVLIE